jgi:hypothetical protein
MRFLHRWVMVLIATLVLTGCQANEPFSIVVLPDTQYYTQLQPELFDQQALWIRDNVEKHNIAFVAHVGDITNRNYEFEWFAVHKILGQLDGVVPYSVVGGNHDIGQKGSADSRETGFNKFFGVKRFEGEPWYGGQMGDTNDNNYCYFSAGGMDFLVLSLEFGPRDETLAWANEVVQKHPDRRIIVVTHSYLTNKNKRSVPGGKWGLEKYGEITGNTGEEMWQKFVKKHNNIFMVLCGHVFSPGTGRQVSVGENGNIVHEVLGNYQKQYPFGGGWLRIMKFIPAENRVEVSTYSTMSNKYRLDKDGKPDPESMFDLEYDMTSKQK